MIPREKLDAVFTAAIDACRERTLQHITLPPGERFTVEYVTNKSWSGYNWYQGNFRSLIQVNTDLPIYIDRAIDLACHEGYPGHHVYNALLEQHLRARIAAGSSSRSTRCSRRSRSSPRARRTSASRSRFPGRSASTFEQRDAVSAGRPRPGARGGVLRRAGAGRPAVVRRQRGGAALPRRRDRSRGGDGRGSSATRLMPHDRAAQRVRFFDQYRSYVINYNFGKDLVRRFIESRGGTADHPEQALAGVRDAAVVAAPALRPAVTCAPAAAPAARWRAAACLAGYVYAYCVGARRHADPLRRLLLLRLPAGLVALSRPVAAGGRRRLLRRRRSPSGRRSSAGRSPRRWVNAHPIGEAIMIAPFFVVAHALTRWTNLSPDGFTLYYQHAAGLAGLCYVLAGLWFLRRLLRRHFGDGVADATVVSLLAGTSLYHYATFDSAWSHAFSFALCAALLRAARRVAAAMRRRRTPSIIGVHRRPA